MTQPIDPLVLGRRLRHHRRLAGLTLDELSEKVGKPAPYLSMLENGKKEPKIGLVMALANAVGIDVGGLLDPTPPSDRDALEIELARAQESRLFQSLDLPTVRPGARMDDETLGHLVGIHRELHRRSGLGTAGSEDVRRANGSVHDLLAERNGYLAEIESAAAEALRAAGHTGPGPFSSRNLLDLVAHVGFELRAIPDMPGFARAIVDTSAKRIYIAQRNELRTRQARKAVLQTVGGFMLGHETEPDLDTFLRQRMETAYFAAAVLLPEDAAIDHLAAAKAARDLDVEDMKELFYVSYEMAAWRTANLLGHHFEVPSHLVVSNEVGAVVKAMVNDGAPVPRDEYGGVETQRLCRRWGSRVTFASTDRFGTHRQYTDTSAGTFFCTTHIEEGREPALAVTLGVPFRHAKWFRGRETENRETSWCPDPSCCRLPPEDLARKLGDSVIVSARSQSRILGLMAPDPYPEMDLPAVFSVLERHDTDDHRQ